MPSVDVMLWAEGRAIVVLRCFVQNTLFAANFSRKPCRWRVLLRVIRPVNKVKILDVNF